MQGTCSSAVTQKFTYMLMKTGTVVLKAQTDMKGYTAGQIIKVMTHIHNQSGKNTGNIAASLMQVSTFYSSGICPGSQTKIQCVYVQIYLGHQIYH